MHLDFDSTWGTAGAEWVDVRRVHGDLHGAVDITHQTDRLQLAPALCTP